MDRKPDISNAFKYQKLYITHRNYEQETGDRVAGLIVKLRRLPNPDLGPKYSVLVYSSTFLKYSFKSTLRVHLNTF